MTRAIKDSEIPNLPNEFLCPFTHVLMSDPRIHLDCGKIFNRDAMKQSKIPQTTNRVILTCPSCNKHFVQSTTYLTIQNLINDWCKTNKVYSFTEFSDAVNKGDIDFFKKADWFFPRSYLVGNQHDFFMQLINKHKPTLLPVHEEKQESSPYTEIFKILFQYLPDQPKYLETALDVGNLELISLFFSKITKPSIYFLFYAIMKCNVTVLKHLQLHYDFNATVPNASDTEDVVLKSAIRKQLCQPGTTLLHCAAYHSRVSEDPEENVLGFLLARDKSLVDAKDSSGLTPLMNACVSMKKNSHLAVDLLIAANANLNETSNNGNTALHRLFGTENKLFQRNQLTDDIKKAQEQILICLIKANIDIQIKDKDGNTALQLAAKDSPLTRFYLTQELAMPFQEQIVLLKNNVTQLMQAKNKLESAVAQRSMTLPSSANDPVTTSIYEQLQHLGQHTATLLSLYPKLNEQAIPALNNSNDQQSASVSSASVSDSSAFSRAETPNLMQLLSSPSESQSSSSTARISRKRPREKKDFRLFSSTVSSSSSHSFAVKSEPLSEPLEVKQEPDFGILKNKKAKTPLTKEQIRNALIYLRGPSAAKTNCQKIASTMIEYFDSQIPPNDRFSSAPSRFFDFSIVKTCSDVQMVDEITQEKFTLTMVTKASFSRSPQSSLKPYPHPSVNITLTNGETRPAIKVEEIEYTPVNYKNLNTFIKDETLQRGGIAFGRIELFRPGANINKPGHELTFYATGDKATFEVTFYEGQAINNGIEDRGPCDFSNLSDCYDFIKHKNQVLTPKTFGNTCFVFVDGPDIPSPDSDLQINNDSAIPSLEGSLLEYSDSSDEDRQFLF